MDKTKIVRVYSGRPGCMCGCKGKYYEPTDRSFNLILNKMFNGVAVSNQEGIWHTELRGRTYVAYEAGR